PRLGVAAELEMPLEDPPVRTVDELVEIHQRFGAGEVAVAEGIESDPDHLLATRPHLLEAFDETRAGIHLWNELRELRDRHAVVGHSLEMEGDGENRQHQATVAGDRRRARKTDGDPTADPAV